MKTNVLLQSESRELLGKKISVMSKDGFVCITEVMEVLTQKRISMGLEPRRIDKLMSTQSFKERANEMVNEIISSDQSNMKYRDRLSSNKIDIKKITDLSKYGLAYKKGKNENQKWFINPYFFVMIALELDPEIYVNVIKWLTDDFIQKRNVAGEAYKDMCSSVCSIVRGEDNVSDRIRSVAKAINYIVFNEHKDGIRNFASQKQLNDIIKIENSISTIIDGGFVKDFASLRCYLGNEWKKRWGNPMMSIIK